MLRPIAAVALLVLSNPAWASEATGLLSLMFLAVSAPWIMIAGMTLLTCASSGTYASERKAGLHALAAGSIPVAGLFILLLEPPRNTGELLLVLCLNGVGVLMAFIPVVAYRMTDPTSRIPHV
jgi:hypothetical protein